METTIYRLDVLLVETLGALDQDIHLVVADPHRPTETMIVEFPKAPRCAGGASRVRRAQMKRARDAFVRACGNPRFLLSRRLNGRATVVGPGFFDPPHGQPGVAPNGIELHPVLSIDVSSC